MFHGTEFRVVFSSTEGFEGNSESLLLFLFHGMELRVVFSSAEGLGRKFREFASIFGPRNGIPSCFLFPEGFGTDFREFSAARKSLNSLVIINCSVYSVFHGIIFLSEIPNPTWKAPAVGSAPYSSNRYSIFGSLAWKSGVFPRLLHVFSSFSLDMVSSRMNAVSRVPATIVGTGFSGS
jgi:hypothetical protein